MGYRIVASPLLAALGLAALSVAGCGTSALFGSYEVPERPETEAAPWPRLVDTPEAPPRGVYTAQVPDPAEGIAAGTDLAAESRAAGTRAGGLTAPVVDAAALRARARAAEARAAGLERPILSTAERQRLLSATR